MWLIILCRILSIPHNIVMDLNNVMQMNEPMWSLMYIVVYQNDTESHIWEKCCINLSTYQSPTLGTHTHGFWMGMAMGMGMDGHAWVGMDGCALSEKLKIRILMQCASHERLTPCYSMRSNHDICKYMRIMLCMMYYSCYGHHNEWVYSI